MDLVHTILIAIITIAVVINLVLTLRNQSRIKEQDNTIVTKIKSQVSFHNRVAQLETNVNTNRRIVRCGINELAKQHNMEATIIYYDTPRVILKPLADEYTKKAKHLYDEQTKEQRDSEVSAIAKDLREKAEQKEAQKAFEKEKERVDRLLHDFLAEVKRKYYHVIVDTETLYAEVEGFVDRYNETYGTNYDYSITPRGFGNYVVDIVQKEEQ